jgi:hypothetical protein
MFSQTGPGCASFVRETQREHTFWVSFYRRVNGQ